MGVVKVYRTREDWKKNCAVVRHGKWVCWEWKHGCGGRHHDRPVIYTKRVPEYAARFAYRLFFGELKNLGAHRCDNAVCVRPSHIEDATHAKNCKDGWLRSKKAGARREMMRELMFRRNVEDVAMVKNRNRAARKVMKKNWRSTVWRKKVMQTVSRKGRYHEL